MVYSREAPQGIVLPPSVPPIHLRLLICYIQKFTDDITGFIRDDGEHEYRGLVKDFLSWCEEIDLQPNISKEVGHRLWVQESSQVRTFRCI